MRTLCLPLPGLPPADLLCSLVGHTAHDFLAAVLLPLALREAEMSHRLSVIPSDATPSAPQFGVDALQVDRMS